MLLVVSFSEIDIVKSFGRKANTEMQDIFDSLTYK